MSLHYLPPVKPSAIALGTIFNQTAELAVLTPLFGQTYQRAKVSNTKEEATASAPSSTPLLPLATRVLPTFGGLIFLATSAPGYLSQVFTEKRPIETVGVSVLAKLIETVGLATFLTWWGTRTNPFE
ncbi:hypothetical protein NKR23_g996 [Pleurostoma richardsiae]|uniref:Uncharacterized protein n=1 Tax=Pleurostoma richardsiae TaxID=41990 RepID=A0AA38S0R8_9PEZI|nr:hypothetical protein NKR23_g996 [Pleurostoma richardsiae]